MAGTEITMTLSLARSASELSPSVPPPVPATRNATPRLTAVRCRSKRKTRVRPVARAGVRAGAWKIESELGTGGMATVFGVVNTRFGKHAALKLAHEAILGPHFTSETFLREARVVNLVDHPAVPSVFATGTFDGRPYLVMERLTGETLGARLERGPMDRVDALGLLADLCEVLAAAHAVGVVHRDIKLDNVFLHQTRSGRQLKLLDWGVAAILGEPDPLAGLVAGTLTYVAPEQVRGDALTSAADVYSLAVLAYQLLLGAPPFAAPKDLDLIRMHLHDVPPAPSSMWAEIPADLDALLLGILGKAAEDRPTLDEVVLTLTQVRAQLVRAARPSKPARSLPVPARYFGAALAIAAAALSVAAMW